MDQILFLLAFGSVLWVVYRMAVKEPIIPGREKKVKEQAPTDNNVNQNKKKKKGRDWEEETLPFQNLFPEIRKIENHMIRTKDNTFLMVAEVEPVNYFLLDQREQDAIDIIFETWLAQISYNVRIYLQNRYVDLSEAITNIKSAMEKEDSLNYKAIEYGENMIRNLEMWQQSQPRYETKRYLIFPYKVDISEIKATTKVEVEEKIIDKAFNELFRRLNTAKGQLRKANMDVQMLSSDGITEVLYYTFNRKKAIKNRYRDIEEKEQLALYVTADQTAEYIARVKGAIEDAEKETKEQASN